MGVQDHRPGPSSIMTIWSWQMVCYGLTMALYEHVLLWGAFALSICMELFRFWYHCSPPGTHNHEDPRSCRPGLQPGDGKQRGSHATHAAHRGVGGRSCEAVTRVASEHRKLLHCPYSLVRSQPHLHSILLSAATTSMQIPSTPAIPSPETRQNAAPQIPRTQTGC